MPAIFGCVQILASLLLATVIAASSVHAADHYALARCQVAIQSSGAEIRPISDGNSYLYEYRRAETLRKEFSFDSNDTKVTVIEAPKHGKVALADVPNVSNGQYQYMPKEDYGGRDAFVMQVERLGVRVRIHYLMEVVRDDEPTTGIGEDGERHGIYCNPEHWKITTTMSAMKGKRELRYDGVYVNCPAPTLAYMRVYGYSIFCSYIRFYKDGHVITGYSDVLAETTLEEMKTWFVLEKAGPMHLGIAPVTVRSAGRVSFSTTVDKGKIDYRGELVGDQLRLQSHSHINGHRSARTYEFSAWPVSFSDDSPAATPEGVNDER